MDDKDTRKGVSHLIREPHARVKADGGDDFCNICTRRTPSRQSAFLYTFALLVLFLVVSSLVVIASSEVAISHPGTMKYSVVLSSLAALAAASPQFPWFGGREEPIHLGPDKDGKYTIVSDGIRAQFIPYGASLTNLFVKDAFGVERDIVLGYDNATAYARDLSHPHLGGVPGKPTDISFIWKTSSKFARVPVLVLSSDIRLVFKICRRG